MTEEPSGPDPDDERTDKTGDGETSHRDESDTERDPFDETFIVKETRETHSSQDTGSSRETDSPQDADSSRDADDASPADRSWLDESRQQDTDQQDDEWGRIPIDLDGEDEDAVSDSDDDGQAPADDEMVPEPSSTPIVSGEPTLEGAVFVVLGAVAMVLVLFRLGSVMLG
ncbi:hypothetical protein HALLA_07865 [Halostagnicola larsenii XH-48]|uniref:DUF7312 domain-containing protein n=1 Tax=Halostagnicola larsenii XH-48 TaxID=797299 RepID=W0JU85_9EURY|nr:hypothetical protein [Halostagnicola larsenii]AHG00790.1 hypothetical protein HALLA_07865 [Halostagnicola larsenii XH-48]